MPRIIHGLDGIRALANQPIGTGDWILITQEMVDAFAELTQDRTWLHTDAARAAQGPFGGTIAHGLLTLSLLVQMKRSVMELHDIGMGLNYGFDRTRMPAPVPVGSRIRCVMHMGDVHDAGEGVQYTIRCTVECDQASKPVLVTDWTLRNYPSAQAQVR